MATISGSCNSDVVRGPYRSIQVNVDARGCNIIGDAANEPSIAVDATDPRKIVIGWRQFDSVLSDFRQAGWAYSHDGGHTWVFRGSLDPGVFGSDPVLAPGSDGEIYYLSINFEQMRLFHSFDGGLTWPLRTQVVPNFYDKPWMTVDVTEGIGRGNVYVIAQQRVFRSFEQGTSFDSSYAVGLVYPQMSVAHNGDLYVASTHANTWRSTNAKQMHVAPEFEYLGAPTDCSSAVANPNPSGLLAQAWVGTDHSTGATRGTVYSLDINRCSPEELPDIYFARTTDEGQTWDPPVRVNDTSVPNTALEWFTMMSVAPNGRIDVAWNDTRNYPPAPQYNLSELYYAYSMDSGTTWSPNVPLSPVFDTHVGWPGGQQKIGDYYHMVSDNLGVNVAYAATFNGEQDIYFLRIGPWDCNGNEIDDAVEIAAVPSRDCNINTVPDECEYRADINGDGLTTLSDFAAFRAALTGPGVPIPADCTRLLDPDHDGDVDLHDLYLLQHVFAP